MANTIYRVTWLHVDPDGICTACSMSFSNHDSAIRFRNGLEPQDDVICAELKEVDAPAMELHGPNYRNAFRHAASTIECARDRARRPGATAADVLAVLDTFRPVNALMEPEA